MPAKVLIVDDHEGKRRRARALITRERLEWDVYGEAKNAQEGVEACWLRNLDVAVPDINMPGIPGEEVASPISDLGSRDAPVGQLPTEVAQKGADEPNRGSIHFFR